MAAATSLTAADESWVCRVAGQSLDRAVPPTVLRWHFEPGPLVQLAMGSLSAANGWLELRATAAFAHWTRKPSLASGYGSRHTQIIVPPGGGSCRTPSLNPAASLRHPRLRLRRHRPALRRPRHRR